MARTETAATGQVESKTGTNSAIRRVVSYALLSLLVLTPCFWHARIEAGDLASHTYNAWLATLVQQDKAPGLQLETQTSNLLFDVLVQRLGAVFGFLAAEKIIVSFLVLGFFWGCFTLISALAKKHAWGTVPLLMMLSYSWTFQMGFINYYASLVFAFWGLALWWGPKHRRWLVPLLAILAWVAHPLGAILLLAAIALSEVLQRIDLRWHLPAVLGAIAMLAGIREWSAQHYRLVPGRLSLFALSGANQFILYEKTYSYIAYATVIFLVLSIAWGWISTKEAREFRTRVVFSELLVLSLAVVCMLPNGFFTSQYAGPVNFLNSRMTLMVLVLAACLWAATTITGWQMAIFAVLAGGYFALLYNDTGRLNRMENQAVALVQQLPTGARVLGVIQWPESQVMIHHLVDRACIGHCFSYANYEPASGQFRLRAIGPNPIVLDQPAASDVVQQGRFVPAPADLPLYQLYQCDSSDKLCMDAVEAGEPNIRMIAERGWLARFKRP